MEAKIAPEYDYIKYTNNDSRCFFPDTFGFFPMKLQMMNHLHHESFARAENTCNNCQIPMELRRLT